MYRAFKISALIYSYRRESSRARARARLKDQRIYGGGRKLFNTFRRINCRVYGALRGGMSPHRCPLASHTAARIVRVTAITLTAEMWNLVLPPCNLPSRPFLCNIFERNWQCQHCVRDLCILSLDSLLSRQNVSDTLLVIERLNTLVYARLCAVLIACVMLKNPAFKIE